MVSASATFSGAIRGFLTELADLSVPQLRQRYQQTTGDDRPRDAAYMIRRLAWLRQRDLAPAAKPDRPRWTAQDIATGRAVSLHCDRCRREVTVGAETVARLRRSAERGEPSCFLCATCRDENHRRDHERAALARTRREIEASRGSRPSAGLLPGVPTTPPSGDTSSSSSPAGGRSAPSGKMSPSATEKNVNGVGSANGGHP